MTSPFFKKVDGVLGVDETNRVLSLYGGVADADLAGFVPIDQGGEAMVIRDVVWVVRTRQVKVLPSPLSDVWQLLSRLVCC